MSVPPSEPRAAYVHVPFCAHRCGYCDFTLVAGRDDLIDDYLRAMELELGRLDADALPEPARSNGQGTRERMVASRRRPLDTLFIGGGTPTHLAPPQLGRLLDLLHRRFELAPGCEFSVEANPAGLNDEHVRVLADGGVNRISLGAQSFDSAVLATLERDHRGEDVRRAVERVRARIDNISLDLIFGVPGQDLASWDATLDQALALEPRHVSTYGLTFEKGTRFWSRRSRGELHTLPDETERSMYAHAMDRLAAAGFEQYEISNFALPGHRCRHNEVYWKGEEYYGFGPGAARYLNGRRETNHRSVTTWLKRVFAGEDPIADAEELSPEDKARESIVLGLRRAAGIERDEFRHRTGFDLDDLAAEPIARHCLSGLLDVDDHHVRLTREGRFLADAVIVDFL
ncbi:MAG: radical SAM family heme chaperone HemW [Planctomycetaceae bacterium]